MAGTDTRRRPWPAVACVVAVAVAVVAVPSRAARGIRADRRVHDGERRENVRVACGQLAEPRELEEAGVDHRALVERRPAVPDVVRDRGVRVAGLREADEVARREWAVGRDRPTLDRTLEVIGDAAPDSGRDRVVIRVGEVGGGDEPGDLGCDRRGRIAVLLLPPLDAECRAVARNEVRSGLDVICIERRIGEVELVGHQQRVRRLVQLGVERVGCGLAVDEAVARHRPVRLLLPVEQEERRIARRRAIAVGHQPRPDLIEVASEYLAVRAEVRIRRVARRDRLAPRRRHARDDRTGEGLVLGGLQDVCVDEVRRAELVDSFPLYPRDSTRRVVESPVVCVPALLRLRARPIEPVLQRALCGLHGARLARAEAERHGEVEAAAAVFLAARDSRGLDDVAVARRGV